MAGTSRACDSETGKDGHAICKSPVQQNGSAATSPPPKKFAIGQDVLARWTDGLFYLGNCTKVDEQNQRCHVRYEDDSEHWCLFKDMSGGPQKVGPTLKDIICCLCQGEASDTPNNIVLCDKCGVGYHQLCHNPTIDDSVLEPGVAWLCRLCIFAATAKKGGAIQKGPKARAMQVMKQTLPYDLHSLAWNDGHNCNQQQLYCYCGGPGEWYMKMLQCRRCQQWFHEACMQCLSKPLVFGDRFFVFICSVCNSGTEYLKRLSLKWADVAQLALFNLTIEHNIKYYDLDERIIPWMEENLENLLLDIPTLSKQGRKDHLAKALNAQENVPRFKSGREIKKRLTWYGLRHRVPPVPPKVLLPSGVQITDQVFNKCQIVPAKKLQLDSITPVPQRHTSKKRRASSDPEELAQRKIKRAKLIKKKLLNSSPKGPGRPSLNQNYKGYGGNASRYKICLNGSKLKSPAVTPAKSPAKKTLDEFIPRTTDYYGTNHPFKTVLECNTEIEHTKLKERLLNSYAASSMNSEADSESFGDSVVSETDSDAPPAAACVALSDSVPSSGTYIMQVRRRKRGRPSKAEIAALNAMATAAAARNKASLFNNKDKPNNLTTQSPQRGRLNKVKPRTQTKNVLDKSQLDGMSKKEVSLMQLKSSVNTYFGAANRLATGETFRVQAKRLTPDGKVQYLVEWEGGIIG